jgi:hypothetical protein
MKSGDLLLPKEGRRTEAVVTRACAETRGPAGGAGAHALDLPLAVKLAGGVPGTARDAGRASMVSETEMRRASREAGGSAVVTLPPPSLRPRNSIAFFALSTAMTG